MNIHLLQSRYNMTHNEAIAFLCYMDNVRYNYVDLMNAMDKYREAA